MNQHVENSRNDLSPGFLSGGGEMGERIRRFDWSLTPVGAAEAWPQSLKAAVQIVLNSRFPMFVWWGRELTNIYNDAYIPILGKRHPAALGMSAREIWAEIWPTVGPQTDVVLNQGQATWSEELLLVMERNNFTEETYFTFSYSPIPADDGGVGGLYCACIEDTARVLSERRLRTLQELAARTTEEAKSVEEACQTAALCLAGNPYDLPFVLIYLLDAEAQRVRLAGSAGLPERSPAAPPSVDLADPDDAAAGWPFAAVLESGGAARVADLGRRFGPLPGGAWPEPTEQAVILPIVTPGQNRLAGFVAAGLSPRLEFNEVYRGFTDSLATHLATVIANARAYAEERRRAEALAELDRAKTAFFSNVSHEFRTPLTLMLSPLQDALVELDRHASPTQRERLEIALRNGLRLQKLVNSLLDFSRIEAGRVRAVYEPTDLAAFTADLASNFRSACEKAGLELRVDCPPLRQPVFVDRQMWERIVLNLLSNAFKFTIQGEIAVTLRQTGAAAVLAVSDTGTGVAAEEMSRLFERFHRIENARARTHEGSGIGLALVQELVKLHGGSVQVESKVGRGTTFTVSVPLGAAHLPASHVREGGNAAPAATGAGMFVEEALRWLPDDLQSPEEAPLAPLLEPLSSDLGGGEETRSQHRPRVLVADDNADMRQYLARLLAGHYKVETVTDGEAALAAVRRAPPDLIVSDVMMPRLDGFGLLRELRADPRMANLPIILLSARAGEESTLQGMQAGADDYLVKPFSARELLAHVSAHLQMARLRREAGESLQASEERFRTLFESMGEAFCIVEMLYDDEGRPADFRFLDANPTFSKHTEFDHPVGRTMREFLPDQVAPWFEIFGRVAATGEPQRFTDEVKAMGRWFDVYAYRVGEAGSNTVGVLLTDSTEKVRAADRERQLLTEAATANAKFRAFFDQGPLFTGLLALDGTLLEANRRCLEECGYAKEEVIGKKFWECGWWNRSPEVMETIRAGTAKAAAGELFRIETPFFVADGRQRISDFILLPIRDESGRVICLAPTGADITDRKRAEDAIRRQSDQLRELAEVATQLNAALDVASITGIVNEEARRLVGAHQAITSFTTDMNWGQAINVVSLSDKYARWRDDTDSPDGSGISALVCRSNRPMRFTQAELEEHAAYQKFGKHGEGHPPMRGWLAAPLAARDGRNLGLIQLSDKYEGDFTPEDEAILVQLAQMASVAIENAHLVQTLRDGDRRKDEFLAILAHELRNPLAPLRNGLQVLKLAHGDPRAGEEVRGMMERQLDQLVHLVDDLLDLSRIRTGKIELRKKRVELAKVVHQAVETSRPLIEQRRHTLTLTLPPQTLLVDADATRLAQVFSNLLNNAAKYTEPGGQIALLVEPQGDHAAVKVRDTGIGIPQAMLPKLFEMFTQVDSSLDRSQGGLGIGLSLVKKLMEMHGGSVEATSEGRGRGSEFIVRLPLATAPRRVASDDEPLDDAAAAGPCRVLVVDDNRDAADSLAMMLKMMGHETQTAHDGFEALDVAARFQPDLILLDIGMPRLNGYETAVRVRQEPWGRNTVLVALTGWGQDEDRRKSQQAGFDSHLTKPLDPEALKKVLTEVRAARR